jgi:hypothetical protein
MTELLVFRQETAVARAVASSADRRTFPVLRALAANPAGLSTADLARQCHSDVKPWKYALTRTGGLLRNQRAAGRVRPAGTVPGSRPGGPAILWQITGEGRDFLSARDRSSLLSVYGKGRRSERYQEAARQCQETARRVALLFRRVRALTALEESFAELEQLDRELEALDAEPLG